MPIFVLSNVNSLLPNVEDLAVVLRSNQVSCAFITETWLSHQINDSALQIDGFALTRRDRDLRIGGRVCAFIKSSIPFKTLDELQDDNFETMWLYMRPYKLPRGISCLIVCVVYHPPSNESNSMIEHLSSKLDLALAKYCEARIFLVGDFNRCPIFPLCRRFNLKVLLAQNWILHFCNLY